MPLVPELFSLRETLAIEHLGSLIVALPSGEICERAVAAPAGVRISKLLRQTQTLCEEVFRSIGISAFERNDSEIDQQSRYTCLAVERTVDGETPFIPGPGRLPFTTVHRD